MSNKELILKSDCPYILHFNGVKYENIKILIDEFSSSSFTIWHAFTRWSGDIPNGLGYSNRFRLLFDGKKGLITLDKEFNMGMIYSYWYKVNDLDIYINKRGAFNESDDKSLIAYLESMSQ
jgi:outer membrane protease